MKSLLVVIITWIIAHPDCLILGFIILVLNRSIWYGRGYYYLIILYFLLFLMWQVLGLFRPFEYWLFSVMMLDLLVMLIRAIILASKPAPGTIEPPRDHSAEGQRKIDWLNGRAGVFIFFINEVVVVLIRIHIIRSSPEWHILLWEHIDRQVSQNALFYDLIPYDPFFWAHIWHFLPLLLVPLYYTFFSYQSLCELCEEHEILMTWPKAKWYTQRIVRVLVIVYWLSHGLPLSFVLLALFLWAWY
jgi:hypothetical protein